MIILKIWRFINIGTRYYVLSGVVYNHPSQLCPNGRFITTTKIIKVSKWGSDCVIVETKSGSEYKLVFEDADSDFIDRIVETLRFFGIEDVEKEDFYKQTQIDREEFNKIENIKIDEGKLLEKIDKILANNEMYIEFYRTNSACGYYKNNLGKITKINTYSDTGLSGKYGLITDYYCVKFGYYVEPLGQVRPNAWTETIKALKIKNIGESDLIFNMKETILFTKGENDGFKTLAKIPKMKDTFICEKGEIITIDRSYYKDKIRVI